MALADQPCAHPRPGVLPAGGDRHRRAAPQRRPFAYTLAPALIVFLILTGVPILVTPVVQAVRGETATWGVVGPIGTLTVALLGLLAWLLSTIQTHQR